jgi:AcrR family transcriptional regulator
VKESAVTSQVRGQRWHDKRHQIVDVAAGLFARAGYHATGTQELCEAVGLGKGALYYYVESKENLLFLIHERVMDYFLTDIGAIAELDVPAEDRLRLLGEVQLSAIATYPDHVWVFLHEYRALTGERAERFRRSRHEFEAYLESVLQEGVDRGEFAVRDVRLAALGWLGMYNYTYLWLGRGGSTFDVQEIAAQYHDILVSGMRASVSA